MPSTSIPPIRIPTPAGLTTEPGTPGITTPHGWIVSFLRDPWGFLRTLLTTVRDRALAHAPITAILIVVGVGVAIGVWWWWWWRRRCQHRLTQGARLVAVLPPPEVDPHGAVAVWSNFVGLLRPAWTRLLVGQPHLVWEFAFSADGVRIQVWVPGVIPPGMVERALHAAWPGARTDTTPAPPPRHRNPEGNVTAGGELRLARSEALPLRTQHPVDSVRALLGAASGLSPGEHAVVQILARPVTGRRVRAARRAGRRLGAGHAPHFVGRLLDLVVDLVTPHTRSRRGTTRLPLDHLTRLENSAQDKAIVDKQDGAQYETRVRYAITTSLPTDASPAERNVLREALRGRAHAIASAFATYSEHNHYRRVRLRHPDRVLARRWFGRGDLLSVPELATLAHLPTDAATPELHRAGAAAVTPPPGVHGKGVGIKPIGISDSNHAQPVGLRAEDARHHVHIIGATGSGKSELMARMVLADAEENRGVVVVDPKGDLVNDILARLPARLGEKVVLFDADSRTRPPVINPLEGTNPHSTVDNLVSIFSRIYASSWGPRTDDILRSGLLTLTALPWTPTLLDLPKLLTSPTFRQRAVSLIHDDVLAGFWDWYDQLSDAHRAHVIAPLMNKLRGFLLRPFVRAAIASGASTVDMDQVLDGGICLVRISRDALGLDTARLVGSIVVARTWQATTRRARIPQHQRHDCGLYLDEFQNFLNLPYSVQDMLAESRGYRLAITLAHQYLAPLPKDIEEGISTNARTKVFFNSGPEDARKLARHTTPRISEHDLANLGLYHIAARLVVNGEETPAFTALTEKLPPPIPGRAQQIRRAARRHAPRQNNEDRKNRTVAKPIDPRRAT